VTATGGVAPWSGTATSPAQYFGATPGGNANAPSDYYLVYASAAISRAYQQLLGRPASNQEIEGQLRTTGWRPGNNWIGGFGLNNIIASIWNSEEATQYRATQAALGTGTSTTTTPPPVTPPPAATPPPATGTSGGGTTAATAPAAGVTPTVNPVGGGGGGTAATGAGATGAAGTSAGTTGYQAASGWTPPTMPTVPTYTPPTLPALPTWTSPTMPAAPAPIDFSSLSNLGNAGTNYDRLMQTIGAYTPAQISQFTAPNQDAYDTQLLGQLSNALNNSEWSPSRIAAMKEVQKEQALEQQRAIEDQINQRFASMGRSGSGLQQGLLSELLGSTGESILGSYRDINEQAAQNRRAELLMTADALNQALTGQMGRATSAYQTGLTGQMAQADQNLQGWQSQRDLYNLALQEWQTTGDLQARQLALQLEQSLGLGRLSLDAALGQGQLDLNAMLGLADLAQTGALGLGRLNLDSALGLGRLNLDTALGSGRLGLDAALGFGNLDLSRYLGELGNTTDLRQLSESGRQFDLSQALAIARFLQDQLDAANQLAYQYTALNAGAL